MTETILCVTPGCFQTASRSYDGLLPEGPFEHDTPPAVPHAVNDPGPDTGGELTRLAAAVDQLVFDALMEA